MLLIPSPKERSISIQTANRSLEAAGDCRRVHRHTSRQRSLRGGMVRTHVSFPQRPIKPIKLTPHSPICLCPLHPPAQTKPVLFTTRISPGIETAVLRALSNAREGRMLKLNICGHEFHAQCLTSWFLRCRVDCPMCRIQFYCGGVEEGGVA